MRRDHSEQMTRLRDSLGKRAARLSAFARGQPSAPAVPTGWREQLFCLLGGSRKITEGICIQCKKARKYRCGSEGATSSRPMSIVSAPLHEPGQSSLEAHNVDPFLYFFFYKAGVRCICVLLSLLRPLGTLPFV